MRVSTGLILTIILGLSTQGTSQKLDQIDLGQVNNEFGYTYCITVQTRTDKAYMYQDKNGWLFGASEFQQTISYQNALPQFKRLAEALASKKIKLAVVSSVPRPVIYSEGLPENVVTKYDWKPALALQNARDFYAALNGLGIYAPDLATAYESAKRGDELYS